MFSLKNGIVLLYSRSVEKEKGIQEYWSRAVL